MLLSKLRADIAELDTRMNDKQAKALFGQIIGSPLKDHLKAEMNFGRFVQEVAVGLHERAGGLIETLEEYQREMEK
ncbi:MAG: hypothetical protein ACI92G_001578 [Candidatus Pelagisphaera sp.]|jgi:hypothetical protein